jgi:hypothetical protein
MTADPAERRAPEVDFERATYGFCANGRTEFRSEN